MVIVGSCDLCIVVANAKRIGKCKRLNCIDALVNIIGTCGNKTLFSLNFLFNIVASMTFSIIF